MLDNQQLVTLFEETAKLLALHGASEFQVRYYQQAARQIDYLNQKVAALPKEAWKDLEGVSSTTVKMLHEIEEAGELKRWKELSSTTPGGVVEMLGLRGLGPKKVRVLWKEMGITNLETLKKACQENQVAQVKGFGAKTQQAIQQVLLFAEKQQGRFHYAKVCGRIEKLSVELQKAFENIPIEITGALKRNMEVVSKGTLLVGDLTRIEPIMGWLSCQENLKKVDKDSGPFSWRGRFVEDEFPLEVLFCATQDFYKQLILQTGSREHLALEIRPGKALGSCIQELAEVKSEKDAYKQVGLKYIPPELREGRIELRWANELGGPALLEMGDLRGAFHNHTTYSDGRNSVEEMARHCQLLGYEYIGLSDHSQQAAYAGGLSPEAVVRQHEEIDRLNEELAPFKIFKGIESDILMDGQLDYAHEVLLQFDFVIASVHMGMDMDRDTATRRVLKAIENPYTTMIGHLTSRLLLKREGFPLDHKAVIEACAAHGVILEINANPWRLDLDWRWVDYALSKGVRISINPDAHDKASIQNMYYGVCVGRKGGLTRAQTFNAMSCKEVAQYLEERKARLH